jgi:hypothetical protein
MNVISLEGENVAEIARVAAEKMQYMNFERVIISSGEPEVLIAIFGYSIIFVKQL